MRPKVSVCVLNYERRDLLRRTLESARAQRYPVEILAVDNASTDGSAEMVRDEFPDVHLVRLPRNVGAAARNAGVAAARGDLVVTLDNDVRFDTAHEVEGALEVFARYPRAAVVNFMIVDATGALSHRDWCHPRDARRWAEH
ncbi:MAG TPA: glycosyltransferase, partial [Methylomirabilota bacterium]|nr:glycosyltransferase [Methylomirabilota bacterium]